MNAELRVGSVEETITVTGETPIVDTQNVRQQTVVSDELLAALPSGGRGYSGIARLVPGMSGGTDVGGAAGIYSANSIFNATVHGKGGGKLLYDGMATNNLAISGAMWYVPNPSTVEETVVEVGGISAESDASGLIMNLVPKEGGNTFRLRADTTYTNKDLQGDNFTDECAPAADRDEQSPALYDVNVTQGGLIKRDRLWFFAATRASGNKNQVAGIYFNKTRGTPFYTPDFDSPVYRKEWLKSIGGRMTWQAAEKHKVNVFADVQSYQVRGQGGNEAPEAITGWQFWPAGLYQVTWSSPTSNRLLLDAGGVADEKRVPVYERGDHEAVRISGRADRHLDSGASTGLRYNARIAITTRTSRIATPAVLRVLHHRLPCIQGRPANADAGLQPGLRRQRSTAIYVLARRAESGDPVGAAASVPGRGRRRISGSTRRTSGPSGAHAQLRPAVRVLQRYAPETNLPAGQFVGARDLPAVHGNCRNGPI